MTIECSLRRRATQARCFAALWLSVAVIILIGTYISLQSVANKLQTNVSQTDGQKSGVTDTLFGKTFLKVQTFSLGTLILGLFAISFACFLLARMAFVEFELAARCIGLADALCIAGEDFARLQKATELFVPKANSLPIPEMFSSKENEKFLELLLRLIRKS